MGTFDMRRPTFIVRDPELIKQIGIKDFEYFSQHRSILAPDTDPLLSNSLPQLVGSKWHNMRTTLSPVFTSSKMRTIFELMSKCGEKMVKHVRDEHQKNGRQELEMKDFISRFANDVIATSAFGIEVDSYREKTNIFYTNAEKIRDFKSPLVMLKVFGFLIAPWLMKKLKLCLMNADASGYFARILNNNFEDREKFGIIRNDMVHLLLQVREGSLQQDKKSKKFDEGFAAVEEILQAKNTTKATWTNDELIAQCFIFFFAGFETISNFLPLLIYELTINRDVQDKLFAEIQTADLLLENGQLTYEALHKMKYLDMVVSEGLRKWAPSPATDRLCMKDYILSLDDRKILIEKDTSVWFPIYGLHMDPKYFPDPEKFMPERFDDTNKRNIVSGSYLPFGIGPRNCIGENLRTHWKCMGESIK
jgi:cytochrome P450 family 9